MNMDEATARNFDIRARMLVHLENHSAFLGVSWKRQMKAAGVFLVDPSGGSLNYLDHPDRRISHFGILFQEIASMLIAFDRHQDWLSKEVKIR